MSEHDVPWKPTNEVSEKILNIRNDLDLSQGKLRYIHVQGPPGVGKTRFSMELCRGAPFENHILYVRQEQDVSVGEIISSAVAHPLVELILIVDEVHDSQRLRVFSDYVERAKGRVRLVSIGSCPAPDSRIPVVSVKPLQDNDMQEVIKTWHPAMPIEHIQYVAKFSDGYVRLAMIAAKAVAQDPSIDTHALVTSPTMANNLKRLIGEEDDIKALYVVAACSYTGWKDNREEDGKKIADTLDIKWSDVKARVHELNEKYHIAPRAGKVRYISPTPLGNYLAISAWEAFPEEMNKLQDVLEGEALELYFERLQSIAMKPQLRVFAKKELLQFVRIEHFLDRKDIRRWYTFSKADKELALQKAVEVFQKASTEDRLQLKDEARRELVWALEDFSRQATHFEQAMLALAELANAENENYYSNNATGVFTSKFLIRLGGTAQPYPDRIAILDNLITGSEEKFGLAIESLSQAAKTHESMTVPGPSKEGPQEPNWRPSTYQEYFDCINLALSKLIEIVNKSTNAQTDALVQATRGFAIRLRDHQTREKVRDLVQAMHEKYPSTREELRKPIHSVLKNVKALWNDDEHTVQFIDDLHRSLEDDSIEGRLKRDVGVGHWEEVKPDLSEIVKELLEDTTTFQRMWPWLTSSEAVDAWRLGQELALQSSEIETCDLIAGFTERGKELRLIGGYFNKMRELKGVEWIESWLSNYEKSHEDDFILRVYISWVCLPTIEGAQRVAKIISKAIPPFEGILSLGFGPWASELPFNGFLAVITALSGIPEYKETAVTFLSHRIEIISEDEWSSLKEVAQKLATSFELAGAGHMTTYYWKLVAKRVADENPILIVKTLLKAQAELKDQHFYLKHSEVKSLFRKCFASDPSSAWKVLSGYLEDPQTGYLFAIGFPKGVVDNVPREQLYSWIDENVEDRAPLVAKLAVLNLGNDNSLSASLMNKYGESDHVQSVFYSSLITGVWSGLASAHWTQLAKSMEAVSKKTSILLIREFATKTAADLRIRVEEEREREAEEDLRYR